MTTLLVNPGSGPVAESGEGWTNTYAAARATAERWLAQIHADGMRDVDLAAGCLEREGRWRFSFTHRVTGVAVVLETHGVDDVRAYEKERVFAPRVYWRGSSTANPDLDDWAAPGYEPVRTYRAVEGTTS